MGTEMADREISDLTMYQQMEGNRKEKRGNLTLKNI
jgi:hypothetical protein